jgi:DNA topoisomerase-1
VTLRERLQSTGIRRSGGPRSGFRYRRARGGAVSAGDLRRIEELRIPPQWTDVTIAVSPSAKVQAVGKDAAGRWQYLYRAAHTRRRTLEKFDRLLKFARGLPALRSALARDMRLPGLPRDKALAAGVAILATSFVRAGSEEYAEENGSFGLATLRRAHVKVKGRRILFDYRGKHGVRNRHEIASPGLSAIVARMLREPGDEVWKYVDESGRVRDVSRWQLNGYVKRILGRRFSAKDFRTWAGTWICAAALYRRRRTARDGKSREKAVVEAVAETAAYLRNTPRACRRSYVHPAVLAAFAKGKTVTSALPMPDDVLRRGGAGLDRPERALLELLKRGRGRTKR